MATTLPPKTSEADRTRIREFADRVRRSVGTVVIGMEKVVDQLLVALLARGHVLVEGVPGTAKTTLAKAFAHVLGIEFHRVQFTPDLLPSDITGTYVFDRKQNEFVLRKGPLFCQLLLADEVNRAPAKTQAALLEAMQETQVTIEGATMELARPFMVLATQNPVEQEGVYRLPEAQLDRFLIRIQVGYPSRETEVGILQLHCPGENGRPDPTEPTPGATGAMRMPPAAFSTAEVLEFQSCLDRVYAAPDLMQYIVDLARATRDHPDVALGASPRASVYVLQCARAWALLRGRDYCTHEDVHHVLASVFGHRLILRPEAEMEGRSVNHVLSELLERMSVLQAKRS